MAVTKIRDAQAVQSIDLTAEVTGILPIANGGTGAGALTGLIVGNGSSPQTSVAAPTGTVVGTTDTQTLTNKRVTPRITTINAPGATPTVATDTYDQINYTGLAAAITSMTTNLTGTPADGQKLMLRFKDDGTARAISWGASYTSSGVAALLATTVPNKTHLVGLLYDSIVGDWICVAVDATGY